MERFVLGEKSLDPVIAGRNFSQASRWPADNFIVNDNLLARFQSLYIDAENRPSAVGAILVRLRPRLGFFIIRNENEDTAFEWLGAPGSWERDRKAQWRWRTRLHSQYANREKKRREPQPSKNAASQL
jgi:hypothetical protein